MLIRMYKNDISSYKSLYALYMCIIEYIVLNIAELHFVSLSYVLQLIFDRKLDYRFWDTHGNVFFEIWKLQVYGWEILTFREEDNIIPTNRQGKIKSDKEMIQEKMNMALRYYRVATITHSFSKCSTRSNDKICIIDLILYIKSKPKSSYNKKWVLQHMFIKYNIRIHRMNHPFY